MSFKTMMILVFGAGAVWLVAVLISPDSPLRTGFPTPGPAPTVSPSQVWDDADGELLPHVIAQARALAAGNPVVGDDEASKMRDLCKPLYGLPHGDSKNEADVRNICLSVGYGLP